MTAHLEQKCFVCIMTIDAIVNAMHVSGPKTVLLAQLIKLVIIFFSSYCADIIASYLEPVITVTLLNRVLHW